MTALDRASDSPSKHQILSKVVFVGLVALGYGVGLVAILIPIVSYMRVAGN